MAAMSPANLASLPPELFASILEQTSSEDLQHTCLSLMRVFPRCPIPAYYLFSHVRLSRYEQPGQLYNVLRFGARRFAASGDDDQDVHDPGQWIRTFKFTSYSADADVVVNLLRILPKVQELTLYIGPNFAPEHLEEVFNLENGPFPSLRSLRSVNLRFRPYVQKATYYQFLKGAYFDSTISALERWPPTSITSFSIIQEPLDKSTSVQQHFAQPLCFFRLDPLADLVTSPVCSTITAFRLRVPARQIAAFMYARPNSLPAAKLLDLSTCNILDSEITHVLTRLPGLHHLLLDHCTNARLEEDYATLGKACALAGVQRAKLREKKLRSWLESNYLTMSRIQLEETDQTDTFRQARRPRKGRRGLATATISLREALPSHAASLSRNIVPRDAIPRIRIRPSLPNLKSISVATMHVASSERQEIMYLEFERGWNEGIAQHLAVCARLRTSWSNGVRVLRFSDNPDVSEDDIGLNGLVDLEASSGFDMPEAGEGECPTLCLAGPVGGVGHMAGCGHQASWEIWDEKP